MASAFNIDDLSAHIEQKKDLFIKDLVFGKGTRTRFALQTGIKSKAHLHSLDVDPWFGDNSTCGFNPDGSAIFSEREIEVANLKVDMEFCRQDLLGKYTEYQVRMGGNNEDLPFEDFLFQEITNAINRKIERLVWQGDKTATNTPYKWIDGIVTILGVDIYEHGEDSDAHCYTYQEGDSAYDKIMGVYNAAPAALIEREDVEIYVTPSMFREFIQGLVARGYCTFNPGDGDVTEIMLPGANVKVVSTPGLAYYPDGEAADWIVCTYPGNLVYGTDMEDNEETLKAWYSEDDDMFRIRVSWNSGVQIAFLDRCVLGWGVTSPAE